MDDLDAFTLVTKLTSLTASADQLGATMAAQGIGVSEKLDNASVRIAEAVDKSSAASERHTNRLTFSTWALVVATILLAVVAGVHAYISATHS